MGVPGLFCGQAVHMTMLIGVLLMLVAWTIVPLPLAVLVGRRFKAAEDGALAVETVRPDLTLV